MRAGARFTLGVRKLTDLRIDDSEPAATSDKSGRFCFRLVVARFGHSMPPTFGIEDDLALWAFDLMQLNGNDLRAIHLEDRKRRLLHQVHATLLTLVLLALLGAGLVGAFLTDRALRPVRQLARAAEELEAVDLSRRLPAVRRRRSCCRRCRVFADL